MSDVDLMRRYGISARSLERLFKKLLDEGEIDKAELNGRLYKSDRSHIVDVVSHTVLRRPKSKKKIRISAGEVVRLIRSGMSDIELMDRYNVSARGLDRLFRKLMQRGDIDREDLEQRKRAFHWADIAYVRSEGQSPESLEEEDLEADDDRTGFRDFPAEHKVLISALLGALCGILLTALFFVSVAGWEKTRDLAAGPKSVAPLMDGSPDPLDAAVQQMISTLESIARGDDPPGNADGGERSPQYEQCLKDCDRDHTRGDDAERALWVNCRKSCVALHSKRLREIRSLYQRPALW